MSAACRMRGCDCRPERPPASQNPPTPRHLRQRSRRTCPSLPQRTASAINKTSGNGKSATPGQAAIPRRAMPSERAKSGPATTRHPKPLRTRRRMTRRRPPIGLEERESETRTESPSEDAAAGENGAPDDSQADPRTGDRRGNRKESGASGSGGQKEPKDERGKQAPRDPGRHDTSGSHDQGGQHDRNPDRQNPDQGGHNGGGHKATANAVDSPVTQPLDEPAPAYKPALTRPTALDRETFSVLALQLLPNLGKLARDLLEGRAESSLLGSIRFGLEIRIDRAGQ